MMRWCRFTILGWRTLPNCYLFLAIYAVLTLESFG